MSYQETAFQTALSERAFQVSFANALALETSAATTQTHSVTMSTELALPASAVFDPGGPAAVVLRYRVFIRRPYSFPAITPGVNDPLAEPVIFFNADAQVNLDFEILNPDGTAYNLTGSTVELLAKPERGVTLTFECNTVDAANGLARYTVVADDFAAGPYQAQIRVSVGTTVFHTIYFRLLVAKAIE